LVIAKGGFFIIDLQIVVFYIIPLFFEKCNTSLISSITLAIRNFSFNIKVSLLCTHHL